MVEILVVTLLFTMIVGSLIVVLNTGEISTSVGLAKTDLQSKVRNIMALIVRDARATNVLEINTNDPSPDHIKFRKVTGIDGAGNYTLEPFYIEYTYDSVSKQLTRQGPDAGGNLFTTTWTDITQSPFYAAAGDPLGANKILSSRKLLIVIATRNNVRGTLNLDFSLSEEVKIRNE